MRVYNPPQVLIIDWFLEIRHNGSRLKVPFAVTRHIYATQISAEGLVAYKAATSHPRPLIDFMNLHGLRDLAK